MKKLSIFLYVIMISLFACEKDETLVTIKSDALPPRISAPIANSDIVILESALGDEMEFTWSDTDYGVETEVTYTLEVDAKCNSFATPLVIGSTTSNSLSVSMENLNAKLVNDFKLAPHQIAQLQMRVKSVIRNKYMVMSEPVPISITPWSDKPKALWIGENSVTAPVLFATSKFIFEGYQYLTQGSFRFANNTVCADTVYGTTGVAGILARGTTSTEIAIATSGYYKIKVDTENLTYEIILIDTWGMIGTATPGGWGSSTAMTYNEDKDVYEKTIDLTVGALKFRANNDWAINYGVENVDARTGSLIFDGPAINIAEDGNYTIIIDFSKSTAPYKYSYQVIKGTDITKPKTLWVPGGYQGFNPANAPTLSALNTTTYEGYVNITSATGIKFTDAPNYNNTNYGYGGAVGTLSTSGADIDIPQAGYYKINVDIANLTYKAEAVTWGLIGTSTTGVWDNSTPMTYDAANDVWKITTDLVAGALKFRANNGWGINYGVADINALSGNLIFDSASLNIAVAGNYTITLDFSKSESPYKYSYSVVKN